ncbi:MAG: HNH endonuclease, partial [Planctomycetaceae bacterium]
MARALAERFWEKVRKTDGCWEWTAFLVHGYGQFQRSRAIGPQRAHRVSWELHNGPIPAGMCVCHRCDNRRCVRPDHLFLGTYADNSADMIRKGRARKGSRPGQANHMSKLTDADVARIRTTVKKANGRRMVPSPAVALAR